jgi:Zn-dependent protease with chaperone function
MKSINLVLIILSIFSSPGIVLAQSSFQTDNLLIAQEREKEDYEDREEEIENNEEDEEEVEEDENNEEDEEEVDDEEQEKKVRQPTPEELARLEKLAAADRLYLAGEKLAAFKLYREAKPVWETEKANQNKEDAPSAFYEPQQLSPGGQVFWRNYQEGKEKQLESQIFSALKLITNRYPEFIPGHIEYAATLKKYEREEESLRVLEKAVNRYPQETKLLKAKMDADIAADRWLEASISARQFALFYPEHPETAEFTKLADTYLEEYKSKLKSKLNWNAIGNAIAGGVGFALTGNLFGPISAIETTAMLLRGETSIGESTAKKAQKYFPMVEDKEVINYVQEIGNKIAKASGRDEFEYEFYVVMDDNLNAFALPGGKVFVNVGAILNTDSEAELAGLLAHEVSHAVLSHGFQLVTQGNLTANIVQYVPYVGSTASNLIVLNYSRDMETQADVFGTRILVASGYAADGVRNLMVKLEEINEDRPNPPAWLSTHPDTSDRVKKTEQLIVDNNFNRYTYEGVDRHQKIKKIVQPLWDDYEKCFKEKKDEELNAARKCAGNEDKEEEKVEEQAEE